MDQVRATKAKATDRIEPKVKANNNAVYEKLFVITQRRTGGDSAGDSESTLEVLTELQEAEGDCPLVMDAPLRESSMEATVSSDLASCVDPFVAEPFVDIDPEAEADAARNPATATHCEAAADDPNAFPIRWGHHMNGEDAEEGATEECEESSSES